MSTPTRGVQRLSHLLAVERTTREAANQAETRAARAKPSDFEGHTRTYEPVIDGGFKYADDNKAVITTVPDLIRDLLGPLADAVDLEASKNETNTTDKARADLVLPDGAVLARGLAGPTLLHLEGAFLRLRKIVSDLPELDPAVVWGLDPNTGLRRSLPQTTVRAEKVEEPLVLYPATDKHPAQTKTVTRDVTVGTWTSVKLSGAIPATDKREILVRLDMLVGACKQAREDANLAPVKRVAVARTFLDFVFTGVTPSESQTASR